MVFWQSEVGHFFVTSVADAFISKTIITLDFFWLFIFGPYIRNDKTSIRAMAALRVSLPSTPISLEIRHAIINRD